MEETLSTETESTSALFEKAHKRVSELCDFFDARYEEVMASDYKEAAARAEFITPFFEALGWDVNNAAHRTIYEKDCVLEKARRTAALNGAQITLFGGRAVI